jgi:hypothetical protein
MSKFEDFDHLPREFWAAITELADKGKKDLSAVASEELKKLLQKVDAKELLLKLLSQGTIEIDAKIRIVPSEKKPKAARPRKS